MLRPASVLFVLLSTAAVAGEPAQFRANAQHDGIYAGSGVPVLHGVKWTFKAAGPVLSSPAVADGSIFFGSNDHNLYALDATTGKLRWKFASRGRIGV